MKITKDTLLGFGLGIAVFGSVLVLTGAVERNTSNVEPLLGSNYPTLNVACSADGSSVYVGAYNRVYRSRNSGKDWEVVLEGPQPKTEF